MNQQFYINFVLKSIIKSMLKTSEKFIMQENRDFEHDVIENNNKIRRYKNEIDLKYYFNSSKFSNLFVIENAFSSLKQKLANTEH